MQTETSIEIDRPIEQVFELTINHVAQWSKTVVEDELIEDKNGDVGTRFRVVESRPVILTERARRIGDAIHSVNRFETAIYQRGQSDRRICYAFEHALLRRHADYFRGGGRVRMTMSEVN